MYSPGGRGHGLGPRYRRPSTTRARASGCSGCTGFFSHALNLRSASRNGGSLSDCLALRRQRSAAFHLRFLHGNFRITWSFTFYRPPSATFPHGDFWDSARRRVRWVRQEVVYHYTTSMFSHFCFVFFLLTPSLQPSQCPLPSLSTDTAPLSLKGPPAPTTDRDDGKAAWRR